jgi:L-2,4-diaminobutyrate decarboxylase
VAVEDEVLGTLADLAGLDQRRAAGTMTSGATASNLTGLYLAREHAGGRVRIMCSALAHFSVARAASILGLGEHAVIPIAVDAAQRMSVAALDAALSAAGGPCAVVATAGTTDFGSVDPLRAAAAVARRHGAWLHVDAAYGGGALFSSRLAGLLDGVAEADSIALDLHKLGWQPVAAGVLLVRDRALLAPLERRVCYLNAADDEAAGYTSLLGRSLRTTRRADAFKVAVTLRALGRDGLGALVEACHDLARHAAAAIRRDPCLELDADPVLTSVVFGHRGGSAVNARIRRRLLREGSAVVGRTEVDGRIRLKLTLLHPYARPQDVDALLDAVAAAGDQEAAG